MIVTAKDVKAMRDRNERASKAVAALTLCGPPGASLRALFDVVEDQQRVVEDLERRLNKKKGLTHE